MARAASRIYHSGSESVLPSDEQSRYPLGTIGLDSQWLGLCLGPDMFITAHTFSPCLAWAGAIHISRSLELYCLIPLGFSDMSLVEVS